MIKKLYNSDCIDPIEGLSILKDESVDIILTDPPYKYLKNQKLEVDFDEPKFFEQVNRVLKTGGFIVLFGRGTSFYRWNYMLSQLGFEFKEEIVWDKAQCSSPLMALSRVHETISIYCKGKGKINKVKIPYLEMKSHDANSIIQDIMRMRSILKNTKSLNAVLNYFEKGFLTHTEENKSKHNLRGDIKDRDRCVNIANSLVLGMNEKSIIKNIRDQYTSIHPTQKPVRLLERILELVLPLKNKKIVVCDPFTGSGSTCEAVENTSLKYSSVDFEFIGWELDKDYFESAKNRLNIN